MVSKADQEGEKCNEEMNNRQGLVLKKENLKLSQKAASVKIVN